MTNDVAPAIRTIAVDLDDTLNNFTETLQHTEFDYHDSYGLSERTFTKYLEMVRNDIHHDDELLCNDYSYFRYKIHQQCHVLAEARPDGVRFMQWLHDNGWTIMICTYRDLRRSLGYTQKWLHANHIPFDYFFTAQNKIVLCKMWEIRHLVDDDIFNILYGRQYGINVYYPIMQKHQTIDHNQAKGFYDFEEVKQWIQE